MSATPNAPVAANNLAFIYAEEGSNLDMALQLAQSAKQALPDDGSVDDTLGWVYYKRNLPSLAVGPLQESVKKLPDNAEARYHLGMVYLMLDDKPKARETLERALKLDPKVGGDAARQALATASR
jgi:tetratricopeptide (TPR) repeat protein